MNESYEGASSATAYPRATASKGRIGAILISDGGVPKRGIAEARIDAAGLHGDRQRHTAFHGGPTRAVCVYACELIKALQAEGHPIEPGAIGENITLAGIDWEHMVPGRQLALGADVRLELTSFAVPCRQIAGAFRDGGYDRVSQTRHPGWSRLYARVMSGGCVRVGDPVWLLDAPEQLSLRLGADSDT